MSYRAELDENANAELYAGYAAVPPVADDAVPDPYWAQLSSGETLLPGAYMPSPMRGAQRPWRRAAALVVITMLVSATTGGICLTYGPGELFRLVS